MVACKAGAPSRAVRPGLILVTTSLGVLIAQVDTSVVNLALDQIGAALHVPVSALQWVVDSYNLVYASLLLSAGTLADLYGRRFVYGAGLAVFTLGSLICGLAPNEAILIAGRGLTGLGAALTVPTSLAILAVAYPDGKARARAIGTWASCYGIALAAGPTIGGLLVDAAGWRSIFLMVVPLSVLAFALTVKALPESRHPAGRRLDLAGQSLAILALGALTLAAIEGPHWGGLVTCVSLGLSLVAGLLFFTVEHHREGALVPLALFRTGLSAAMAVGGLMTFGMYAMLFLVPLYLQTQRGLSAFEAGLALLPLSLIYIVISQRSGHWAARIGPKPLMTAGMGLMGTGLLLLARLSPDTGLVMIEIELALLGIGLGLNTGPVNSVAVASVPPARSGTASGLLNTARMIGATLGVAILGTVFAYVAQGGGADFFAGWRMAFMIGALGELLGALIAFRCVGHEALERRATGGEAS